MADVKITITGDNVGLLSALDEAKAAVKSSTSQMQESFKGVQAAAGKVALAIAAIMAVVHAFKEAIDASAGAALKARELGLQLGISATKAGELQSALAENGVSADAYSVGAAKVTATLKTNEKGFNDLGVATRDSNGNLRSTLDIITDTNSKLGEFTEGTDRNVEASKLYGKGWETMIPTMRITAEAMAEAKKNVAELGLEVGERGLANAEAYRKSMAGVGDVFQGLWKAVGDALVPVLTSLGEWFRSIGPETIEVFKHAIVGVNLAFQGFKLAIIVALQAIAIAVEEFIAVIEWMADLVAAAFSLDWGRVKDTWNNGLAKVEEIAKVRGKAIAKAMEDAQSSVADSFAVGDADKPIAEPKAGAAGTGTNTAAAPPSQMAGFQADLALARANYAQQEAAHGAFVEYSLQQERDYWAALSQLKGLSAGDGLAIDKRVSELDYAIAKQSASDKLETLKTEISDKKNNLGAQLALQEEYLAQVSTMDAGRGRRVEQAERAVLATKQAIRDEDLQLQQSASNAEVAIQLAAIDRKVLDAKAEVSMGRMTQEELLAIERDAENKSYAIKREAMVKVLELQASDPNNSPVARSKLYEKLELLDRGHTKTLEEIDRDSLKNRQKLHTQFDASLKAGFTNVISSFLHGTKTLGQTIRGLFGAILDSVIGILAQIAAEWLVTQLFTVGTKKAAAGSNVAASAAEAGAAGVASMAGAPWPLDMTAPLFGAAMAAAAMAFGVAAIAEGGYDIPAGVNPKVQAHEREMILPAHLADPLRDSLAGGGMGGKAVNLHIHTADAKATAKLLMNNRGAVAKALRRHFGSNGPARA